MYYITYPADVEVYTQINNFDGLADTSWVEHEDTTVSQSIEATDAYQILFFNTAKVITNQFTMLLPAGLVEGTNTDHVKIYDVFPLVFDECNVLSIAQTSDDYWDFT